MSDAKRLAAKLDVVSDCVDPSPKPGQRHLVKIWVRVYCCLNCSILCLLPGPGCVFWIREVANERLRSIPPHLSPKFPFRFVEIYAERVGSALCGAGREQVVDRARDEAAFLWPVNPVTGANDVFVQGHAFAVSAFRPISEAGISQPALINLNVAICRPQSLICGAVTALDHSHPSLVNRAFGITGFASITDADAQYGVHVVARKKKARACTGKG